MRANLKRNHPCALVSIEYLDTDREVKGNGPLGELTAYPPPCLLDASQRNAIRLASFAMLR